MPTEISQPSRRQSIFISAVIVVSVAAGTAGVVLEAGKKQQQVAQAVNLEACVGTDPIYDCLNEKVTAETDAKGIEAGLTLLEQKVSDDSRFQSLCHSLTHTIGHIAWTKEKDIARGFERAGTKGATCASGYYHGVIEYAVEDIPREEIIKQVPTICAPFAVKPQSLDHYNCVHGLGHGLFALRLDDWRLALNDCAALKTTWEQESCASGVFMQNVVNEIAGIGHESDFKDDDPLYPCTAAEERWWRPCYLNQSSHIMYTSASNFTAVFKACTNAPESMKSICYQSSGRDVAGLFRTDDVVIRDTCLKAGSGAKDCVIGATRDEVYHERGPNAARALCTVLSGELKGVCESTIETDLAQL